jgi:prohibitin 2
MGLIQTLIFLVGFAAAALLVIFIGVRRDQHGEVVGINVAPIVVAVVVFIGAMFLNSSFGEIGAGERGVVTRFGAVTGQILNPGLYTIMPVVNSVVRCNVQVQAYSTKAEGASSNMQTVHTNVTLNYHVRPESCVTIVRDLSNDLADRIIVPGTQEAVKASTAQYTAQQLITQRPAVRDAIEKVLSARLEQFGAHADALSITQFDFSADFNAAIEAVAVAQQKVQQANQELQQIAIQAQQKVKQAQADREAAILNAEGNSRAIVLNAEAQAKALELQKAQITPELVRLRQVEALNRWVDKWDGKSVPTVVMGQGQGIVPWFQIPGSTPVPDTAK